MKRTAILVDGIYFLKGLQALYLDTFKKAINYTASENIPTPPAVKAVIFNRGCEKLLQRSNGESCGIKFYDAINEDLHIIHPISKKPKHVLPPYLSEHKKFIEFVKDLRSDFTRKTGYLAKYPTWKIPKKTIDRISSEPAAEETIVKKYDIRCHFSEKSVDMLIGLDISEMSLKRKVDQIILIAGDGDYVPAARTAKSCGISFLLAPVAGGEAKTWEKQKFKRLYNIWTQDLFPTSPYSDIPGDWLTDHIDTRFALHLALQGLTEEEYYAHLKSIGVDMEPPDEDPDPDKADYDAWCADTLEEYNE